MVGRRPGMRPQVGAATVNLDPSPKVPGAGDAGKARRWFPGSIRPCFHPRSELGSAAIISCDRDRPSAPSGIPSRRANEEGVPTGAGLARPRARRRPWAPKVRNWLA
jgi:hypothetical protein